MTRATSGWLWGVAVLAGVVPVRAFHDGGVATCSGCHVMHEGATGPAVAGLLIDNASDLCLSCHADAEGEVLGVDPLLPPPERGGGNFVFLLEDNLNDGPDGGTNPIPGEAAGHNIVAPGNGLVADSRYSTAPGGSFPAAQLSCTSCHDPHGRAGFRLLNGVGPVQEDVATFLFPAPQAVGIALDGAPEAEDHHTAYVAGMSDWCANCHGRYHDAGGGGFEHPVDEIFDTAAVDQYNVYNGDADPTGGTFLTAYVSQVPFEDPGAATGSRTGATAMSRVTCLSCHRAHATSAPAAGRWDFNVALLADDGVVSGSWAIPQPYGPGQGTLCTQCHEGGPPPAAPR
jgi:predicted CXXCH cytochrome family protein